MRKRFRNEKNVIAFPVNLPTALKLCGVVPNIVELLLVVPLFTTAAGFTGVLWLVRVVGIVVVELLEEPDERTRPGTGLVPVPPPCRYRY